ncbi:hypothetical protein GCM10009760_25880 [Kitasatospora kazusensis]|uniref:DUF1003 domain-containing protein n=1 Tax=Kitasatospora kazusensis TaxID=407974 RepID=A0ABN2ZFU1_9ACTN
MNERIALWLTKVFGSMWVTYLFFLYGFAPLLWPGQMVTFLYWSGTVQLWALPLLLVGSNVIGRAAERQATETHDMVAAELVLLREERQQLADLLDRR